MPYLSNVFAMKTASKQETVNGLADELKSVIKKPDWADYVKTGPHKERPPMLDDWWYQRAGSMLLKINKLGPVGVSKLRTKYGNTKNRGVRPGRFVKSGGAVIRRIMQQLEKAQLIKQDTKGKHKGRVITPKAEKLIAGVTKKVGK